MKMELDVREVVERTADDRGRITIGIDQAGETVTVAILQEE